MASGRNDMKNATCGNGNEKTLFSTSPHRRRPSPRPDETRETRNVHTHTHNEASRHPAKDSAAPADSSVSTRVFHAGWADLWFVLFSCL